MTLNWRTGILMAVAVISLAGCSSDDEAVDPVSGTPTSNPSPSNMAPSIAGTPMTSVAAGSFYSFTPAASDADGDMLSYTISGKPTWAVFSVATGALTGGAQAGTYGNIIISVSDGKTTRTLPAFTLTVSNTPATSAAGTASLSWSQPGQYTDGAAMPLTDLAGYNVYHGTSATALNESFTVSGASNTRYTFSGLAKGTHYFAVSAVTVSGEESSLSVTGSKTIL